MSVALIVLLQGIEITPFVDPWSTTTMRLSNPSVPGIGYEVTSDLGK